VSAYTDADVKAAWAAAYGAPLDERKVFPIEFRDIEDAVRTVAPAIAARALREFADSYSIFDQDYDNAFVAAAALERADEIEGKA